MSPPSREWGSLSLLEQEELLEHIVKCDSFLYLAHTIRGQVEDLRDELENPGNTDKRDTFLKGFICGLRSLEGNLGRAVEEVRSKVDALEAEKEEPR